jgi:Divergent InlB B-repeat domain
MRPLLATALVALALAGSASARPGPAPSVYRGTAPAAAGRVEAIPWCGEGETSANRPDTSLSSRQLVRPMYVIPADGPDQFGAYAPLIAQDLAVVDAWWQQQDPTRTPRFDLADFPGCTSRFGRLDLAAARLTQPGSAYSGPDRELAIAAALAPTTSPDTKTIVFYDGPVPPPTSDGDICGSTDYLAPGQGGSVGFVYVWMRSTCPSAVGTGTLGAAVAAHELTHNLGAVQTGAPHQCPALHDGHVCDSTSDLMYWQALDPALAALTLDVGRDDYYAHSGAWWDVQDSGWLEHLPERAVTLATSGTAGTVRLTGASGLTVTCPPGCTATLEDGAAARVEADPGPGSRFLGWQGAGCTGTTAPCGLTATADTSATAVFGPDSYTARVGVKGKGRVTSNPPGISCPRRCTGTFAAAEDPLELRARPARGYRFTGWTGGCHGRRICTLTIDTNAPVRATFKRRKSS